ncbi:uncharacterized protein LOC142644778 [Castanea sativa]|uniref:uncharacterized protein LOC142644778 n=1 Tax=Castanea sativa TaxID=21020 RepID=UPI003F65008C
MSFVGYLFFALKCFDLFSSPLFSLGYPLCASICAIESNSNSDTRKLIAYWVFYSLISLFEHTFMKVLEWLPFWPYMKLMIMYWLMIPHFSGALYFYELLVQPCLSLVPQIVINLFNEWKKPCLKRDDFPTEAVRYQKQNKSEASVELISSDESKSIENNVGQKEDKDVEVTEENEDVEVTEENEDIEVTEKNEVAAIERVTPIESTLVQTGKSTETVTDMNVTSKSTPDSTEVRFIKKEDLTEAQKEWACAICQVTIQSETTLNSHLQGKRHKPNCEVLKAITRAKMKSFPTSTPKKHEQIQTQKKCASSNGLKEEVNIKQSDVHGLQINSKKIVQDTRSLLLCCICNVWCPSKDNLDAHLKGKKHLARIQELADFVEGQHA